MAMVMMEILKYILQSVVKSQIISQILNKLVLSIVLCGFFVVPISAQEFEQVFDKKLWKGDIFGRDGNRIKLINYLNFATSDLIDSTIWHGTESSTIYVLGEPDGKCDFGYEISYLYFLQGFYGFSDAEINELRPFCDKGLGFGYTKLVLKFNPNGDYKSYAIIHAGG